MSEFRTYTCLACSDRPVFHGKIGAAMHLRSAHAALLEDHHLDELLQQGPEYVPPTEEHTGPYVCLLSFQFRGCDEVRSDETGIKAHIWNMHNVGSDDSVHGEHYVSVEVQKRNGEYAQAVQPLTPSQLDTAAKFERVMLSISTVRDFLTECRA